MNDAALSKELQNVFSAMLHENPEERPSI